MLKIVDSHHKVLPFWSEFRKTQTEAPRLITLDHHTDTSPPFRKFIREQFFGNGTSLNDPVFLKTQREFLDSVDFNNLQSVNDAVTKLNNDEHIITAIKTDIISSAFVLAHNADNTNIDTYKEHKVACCSVEENDHPSLGKIPNHDTVLESPTLDKAIYHFNNILELNNEDSLLSKSFILDIDLDFFNTFKSIEPEDLLRFKELSKKAGLITIATEPEYVKTCAIDKTLSSDYLLEKLSQILN